MLSISGNICRNVVLKLQHFKLSSKQRVEGILMNRGKSSSSIPHIDGFVLH